MKILVVVLLSLFSSEAAWSKVDVNIDVKTFPAGGIKKIKISSPKGIIRIATLPSSSSSEKIKYDEKCQESRTIYGEITFQS